MAVDRELFSILQTGASGAGSSPTKKSEGDVVASAVEMPVLPSKDLAGNFQHIPIRASGDDVPTLNVPVLAHKDLAGDVRHSAVRAEGEAIPTADILAAMVAKTSGGLIKFIQVDANGVVQVNSNPGTPKSASAEVDSVVGSFESVVTLTLVASKTYDDVSCQGFCSFLTSWRLVQIDNLTETILGRGMSGPGNYVFNFTDMNLRATSGATGTQSIVLRGKQEHGSAQVAGLYGNVTAIEG